MNLKERGITVGDLLIILIFGITTLFFINKLSEDKQQASISLSSSEFLSSYKI